MLSDACEACGLFRKVQSYCIQPERDTRVLPEELHDLQPILFVGQAPGFKEDLSARVFINEDASGGFLRYFLRYLGSPWALTNAVRCYPGKNLEGPGDIAPTDEQLALCGNQFLAPLIADWNPKVIITLGYSALKGVLGDAAPKSIAAAGRNPIRIPDSDRFVLATYHPVQHVMGRQDLRREYLRIAKIAVDINRGLYKEIPFTHELIFNPFEAMEKARRLPYEIWVDVEVEQSDANPRKLTFWHPDTFLICLSVTCWRRETDTYETFVIAGQALTAEVVTSIVRGRRCGGHNFKYDIQAIWIYLNVDMLVLCPELYDSLLDCYLPDQSQLSNGLKPQADLHFASGPYDKDLWDDIAAENQRRLAAGAWISKENTARRKKLKGLGISPYYEPWELEAKFDQLGIPENQRQELRLLAPAVADAGMSAAPIEKTGLYCGKDTFYSARLEREIYRLRPPAEQPDPLTWELCMKRALPLLIRIERRGLPVDRSKIDELKHCVRKKVQELKLALLQFPQVKRALREVPEAQHVTRMWLKGKLSADEAQHRVMMEANPFGGLFSKALLLETFPEALSWIPKTKKTKQPSINDDVIAKLANGVKDVNSERTDEQLIWYYIYWYRKHQKTLNDFLGSFSDYIVQDAHGFDRIHTFFKLSKSEKQGTSSAAGAEATEEGGTNTGRTASASPNLQNLKKDKLIRRCFVAPPGHELWEFDYDRIEPTTMSVLANCESWKQVFRKNWDLYCMVANTVYKPQLLELGLWVDIETLQLLPNGDELIRTGLDLIKEDKRTKHLRGVAKVSTLAIIYGEEVDSFATRNNIDKDVAKAFFEEFFRQFHEIRVYMDKQIAIAKAGGMARNPFGRKRRFFHVGNDQVDLRTNRQIINMPNQSDANDIALWQGARVVDWLMETGLISFVYPILFTHDSLTFEAAEGYRHLIPKIKDIMQDTGGLPRMRDIYDPEIEQIFDVPIRVSEKVGRSMADMMED